ncbi:hypothetical protein LINGRAHAP2_LOCUS376, partial [Linum grandiflorum]
EDETIDCVDIYKQLAFNNPLLKNHTLQLKPSSYPTRSKLKSPVNSTKHIQIWHMNEEYCPKGTIAILRSSTENIVTENTNKLWAFENNEVHVPLAYVPTYFSYVHLNLATVLSSSDYYGLNVDMSVWSPQVQPNEFSSSQVSLFNGEGVKTQSFHAGWMVSKQFFDAMYFSLFECIYRDGTEVSGCYNLECPGFVQMSSTVVLGSELQPVSIYGGQQFFINLQIHKDFKTGNWWLKIQGTDVGYWPAELLPNFKTSAREIQWGGKVSNTKPKGFHTATQMGSGHFPNEGFGKAAWFNNLEYVDDKGSFQDVRFIQRVAWEDNCYDVEVQDWDNNYGTHFLYGGPGYSSLCQH